MKPMRSEGACRRLGAALALPLALALALGCGHSGSQTIKDLNAGESAAKAPEPDASAPRVALIMKTLTNPFFVEMEKGARKAQQETKIDLQVKTATQETSI